MGLGHWIKKQVKKVVKVTSVVGAVIGSVTGIGAVAGIAGSLLLNKSSSSSNTNTGTVNNIENDLNVYIPETTLEFEGNLLKPNTRLYAFFDGRDVTQYIEPEGQTMGAPLISDASGQIKGKFHIPNTSSIKFIQGKKELKFTDSSKNDANETTFAITYYTYSGSEDLTESQDVGGTQYSNPSADPMVQSFLVLDRGGVYLKAVNLYFFTKDNKFPILFQIREVVEDTVSELYLTNSNFILYPSDINTSTDGSVPTTINLHTPVYLQEGKEYAIYLATNAPSTYMLSACEYGETNAQNQLSTKDPRIGGLLKNLGAGSWLKDTTKGIQFVLYKCAFDTTKKYTLALDNQDMLTKILDNNALATTNGTKTITVTDPNHGFNVGDYVTVSGLPAGITYGGISSDYINGIHKIDSVTYKTYTFSTYHSEGSDIDIPTTADASVIFGVNVVVDTSCQYDTITINDAEILLSNTKLEYTFKGLSGQSLDGNETPNVFDSNFIEITNTVDYNTAKVKKINSPYNEANLNPGSEKSLQVNVLFSTNNENITPVIDVANTTAYLVENIINDQSSGELDDVNPTGIARYITKDVQLVSQSNGIHVRFDANVQGSANIRVFYKVLPIESTQTLADRPWVEMTLDNDVAKANNDTTFNEYRYTASNLGLFKAFKTKVLMTSPDSTKPPLLKSYRAIAFQSIENE